MHWVTRPGTSPPGDRAGSPQRASRELRAIPGVRELRRPHRPGGAGRGDRRRQLRRELDQRRPERRLRQDARADRGDGRRGYPGPLPRRADLPERAHRGGADGRRASRSSCASSARSLDVLRGEGRTGARRARGHPRAGRPATSSCRSTSRSIRSTREPRRGGAVRPEAGRHPARGGGDRRRARRSSDIFRDGKVYDVDRVEHARTLRSDVREHPRPARSTRPGGGHVRLADVADVHIGPTPNRIKRENGSRRIDVGRQRRRAATSASVVHDVEDRLGEMSLPARVPRRAARRVRGARGGAEAGCWRFGSRRARHLPRCSRRARQLAAGGALVPARCRSRSSAACWRRSPAAGHLARLAGRLPHRARHRRAQRHHADQPLPASRARGG